MVQNPRLLLRVRRRASERVYLTAQAVVSILVLVQTVLTSRYGRSTTRKGVCADSTRTSQNSSESRTRTSKAYLRSRLSRTTDGGHIWLHLYVRARLRFA